VNGRWQYRGTDYDEDTAQRQAAEGTQYVGAESLGTPGGFWSLFNPEGGPSMTPSTMPNAGHWQQVAREGANRQQAKNPYSSRVADQSRGAQLALLQQMRGQAAGPSLAGMQGTQAMGQGLQAALRGASMGQPGRAMMVGAGQQGAGMAGDVARARLAEQMRASAGMGGLAGGLRGNDLRSADEKARAGLQAQALADQSARGYAQTGTTLGLAQDRLGLENAKLIQRIKQQSAKKNEDAMVSYLNFMLSLTGGGGV
jgi:hypothetical protein